MTTLRRTTRSCMSLRRATSSECVSRRTGGRRMIVHASFANRDVQPRLWLRSPTSNLGHTLLVARVRVRALGRDRVKAHAITRKEVTNRQVGRPVDDGRVQAAGHPAAALLDRSALGAPLPAVAHTVVTHPEVKRYVDSSSQGIVLGTSASTSTHARLATPWQALVAVEERSLRSLTLQDSSVVSTRKAPVSSETSVSTCTLTSLHPHR